MDDPRDMTFSPGSHYSVIDDSGTGTIKMMGDDGQWHPMPYHWRPRDVQEMNWMLNNLRAKVAPSADCSLHMTKVPAKYKRLHPGVILSRKGMTFEITSLPYKDYGSTKEMWLIDGYMSGPTSGPLLVPYPCAYIYSDWMLADES